jgi:hypothetical protein
MLGWLTERYGRRGTWLVVLGAVWIIFGVGILQQPTVPRPGVLNEYLPAWTNAIGWWVTGAVALREGLRGRGRDDSLGHAALYVMPAVRAVSFALSWLLWGATSWITALPQLGWAQGWYAAVVWSLVIIMLRLVADWPNPQPFPAPPDGAARRS